MHMSGLCRGKSSISMRQIPPFLRGITLSELFLPVNQKRRQFAKERLMAYQHDMLFVVNIVQGRCSCSGKLSGASSGISSM